MSLSFFVCIFAKNGVSCLKRKKGTALTIQKKKVIGYSLFTIFLWASAYPLTKIAQTHFTVVPLAFLRSFIAGSFMLFIGKFQGTAEEKANSVIPACGGAWVCDLYGGNEYRLADIAFRNVQPSGCYISDYDGNNCIQGVPRKNRSGKLDFNFYCFFRCYDSSALGQSWHVFH